MPLTLTGTLAGHPDAATGLVHLGGGRWYDPALGRPLQPNTAGGPPTVPQVLNRYAATPLGQPGVYAAAVSSGIPAGLQSVANQMPGLLVGGASTILSNDLASMTIHRIGFTGYALVQAEGTARQIAALAGEWRVTSSRLAEGAFRRPLSLFFARFRIQTAQRRMFVGQNLQYLDDYAEGLGLNGVQISLIERELGSVVDDAATREVHRLAARLGSITFKATLSGIASGTVQWLIDSKNPYLSFDQKIQRATVSTGLGFTTGLIGASIGGPIGAGVGFVIGAGLDYFLAPCIFQFIGAIPNRNLFPLTP